MNEKLFEQENECLPRMAWVFMAVAVVPHLLAQLGLDVFSKAAAVICFPLSMGPLAVAHGAIMANSLGFTTHMAWISALLFSLIWFPIFCASRRRNTKITLALSAGSLILFAGWLWLSGFQT